MVPLVRERLALHWTRERVTLVVLGIVCFYVTYVSYRNLKSALPFVRSYTDDSDMFDRELNTVDRVLFFGHQPGPVLHDLLGTDVAAHLLSLGLPVVPAAGAAGADAPGWCGRATSPSATGSRPRSASPGRSAPRRTTRCRRSARSSSTSPGYTTSPTPRPPT